MIGERGTTNCWLGSLNRPHPGAARCQRLPQEKEGLRTATAGAARGHRGLAVPNSLAAGLHGIFKQALSAGPEEVKPFSKRSLKY